MKSVSRAAALRMAPLCSLMPQSIIYAILPHLLVAFSLNKAHH